MNNGVQDLMDGVSAYVQYVIDNSGQLLLKSCIIGSYDTKTHKYTGTIDGVNCTNIQSICSEVFSRNTVVKVLCNKYNNVLNNITIIGKIQ